MIKRLVHQYPICTLKQMQTELHRLGHDISPSAIHYFLEAEGTTLKVISGVKSRQTNAKSLALPPFYDSGNVAFYHRVNVE